MGRVHRDDFSRNITALEKFLGGGGLIFVVTDVQNRKRISGIMIRKGHCFITPVSVMERIAQTFAICCQRLGERKAHLCPATDDSLDGSGSIDW